MTDVIHSHSILAFFDLSTPYSLISNSSLASHSIPICADSPRGSVQKMG